MSGQRGSTRSAAGSPLHGPPAAAGLGAGRAATARCGPRRSGEARLDHRLRDRQPAPPARRCTSASGRKFDRVELVDGPGAGAQQRPPRRVRRRELDHYLPKSLRGTRAEPRMASYLRWNPPGPGREGVHRGEGVPRRRWAGSSGRATRQPFALVVDSFDAHEPWDAPRRLIDMYGPPASRGGVEPIQPFPTPAAQHERRCDLDRSGCCAACASCTRPRSRSWTSGSGSFLDRLANLGLADNTLVVLVQRPRRAAGRVRLGRQALLGDAPGADPRAVRDPPPGRARRRGRRRHYFASTHDVGPTVLSVLGVDEPRGMNGADLSPLLDGKPPRKKRSYRTAAYNTFVSAGDGRWLLIADNRPRGAAPVRPQARPRRAPQRRAPPPEAGAPALGLDHQRRRRQAAALPEGVRGLARMKGTDAQAAETLRTQRSAATERVAPLQCCR